MKNLSIILINNLIIIFYFNIINVYICQQNYNLKQIPSVSVLNFQIFNFSLIGIFVSN
jgi:hypothetical protein